MTDIQALHVARKLRKEEPCPACGSLHHPAPATGDPSRQGRHEAFEAAQESLELAKTAEQDAKAALIAAQALLKERQGALTGLAQTTRDRDELLPILTEVNEQKAALDADTRFDDLADRLSKAETLSSEAGQELEGAKQAVADRNSELSGAQSQFDAMLREVPEPDRHTDHLTRSLESATSERDRLLNAHQAALEADKETAVTLASAEQGRNGAKTAVGRASDTLDKASKALTDGLTTAQLSAELFQSAKADVDQIDDLEATIQSYEQNRAANVDRLKRLKEEIGDRERPDVVALKAQVTASETELETDQNERTRLKTELGRKQGILESVAKISTALKSLEERYAPLGEISNLVTGNNDRKVRLPDFAIAAMFDEVLVAANLRLGPMSNHRYQLHRPEDVSGGVSKRGLDIAVHDANTEKSRSTKTLSGGEGFQASLALALGLSDVVQQNSGGIKLDAIFIDEGFGTLDDETLNTALETLHSLTNEMRAVGLISHTEQVKSLITAGFDIEVTPSGSHIHARAEAI